MIGTDYRINGPGKAVKYQFIFFIHITYIDTMTKEYNGRTQRKEKHKQSEEESDRR
jgi:hypothetical protein